MLYRHFKGGVYFLLGNARPSTSAFFDDTVEYVTTAKMMHEEGLIEADVVTITDKRSGFKCFLIFCEQASGDYCFYKDVYGEYWLRPKREFFSEVDGKPRFEKMDELKMFDLLMEQQPHQN